jgi:hypothetical protein
MFEGTQDDQIQESQFIAQPSNKEVEIGVGIRASKAVTDSAWAEFVRGGWFAPPWVFGGVLTGAAIGLEGRKRRER